MTEGRDPREGWADGNLQGSWSAGPMPTPGTPPLVDVPTIAPVAALALLVGGCCLTFNSCGLVGTLAELAAPTTSGPTSDPATGLFGIACCTAPVLALVVWAIADVRRTTRLRRLVEMVRRDPGVHESALARALGIDEAEAVTLRAEAVLRGHLHATDEKPFPSAAATPAPGRPENPAPIPMPALPRNPPAPIPGTIPTPPPLQLPEPPTYSASAPGARAGAWRAVCTFCKTEVVQDHEPEHRQKCPGCRAPLHFTRT